MTRQCRSSKEAFAAMAMAMRLVPALAAGLAVGGCNVVAPAAYLAFGLPEKKAEYTLPDRPTVVFVDDRANAIPARARTLRLEIAEKTTSDLLEKKCLTTMIRSRDAQGYATAKDRHGALLPIAAIAREVGAEQIIYVEMLQFSLSADEEIPRPIAQCRVRVIDALNSERLFPVGEDAGSSVVVHAMIESVDPLALRSPAEQGEVYVALARELGDQVGKLFYDWVPRDIGHNLNPR